MRESLHHIILCKMLHHMALSMLVLYDGIQRIDGELILVLLEEGGRGIVGGNHPWIPGKLGQCNISIRSAKMCLTYMNLTLDRKISVRKAIATRDGVNRSVSTSRIVPIAASIRSSLSVVVFDQHVPTK